jgi:hypothetical protein
MCDLGQWFYHITPAGPGGGESQHCGAQKAVSIQIDFSVHLFLRMWWREDGGRSGRAVPLTLSLSPTKCRGPLTWWSVSATVIGISAAMTDERCPIGHGYRSPS